MTLSPDSNGGQFQLSVPASSFSDPVSTTPDFTFAATGSGGSPLPAWLTFQEDAGGNAVFTGTAPVDPTTVGVVLTATSQATGGSGSESFKFIDPGSDQPQLVNQTDTQVISAGQPYTIDLGPASSIFSVPDGAALSYAATQADGSALPSYIAFSQSAAADSDLMLSGSAPVGGSSTSVSITAMTASGHSVADMFNVVDHGVVTS